MAIAVLLILLVGIVLFVTEIIPLPVTAMSMCVAFYLTGAVDASTALAAFSSGTAMIIVCMAIVGEAVFKTGGAAKIAHVLTKFAGSERKLMFVTVLFSGLMSGFLSNTGAAGLLIALILGISLSTGMKRSKLMYPVIVGCCFGGGITIVGTTSGPYLKEALEGLGTGMTFSFFEWAPLSLILLVASAIYMATIGYKLLPAFIADRIQDLTANGNVVQRGVYRQDAIKLWKTSPVIGRGLGGFENGVVSVQDYYYETKYAHNHYVESLCDLGILGLAAFLAMLGTSIWALVKSRKEKPLIVMLLGACVLQMFGQAISDVTWSVGCCVPTFFAVLALVTLHCGDSLRLNVPNKSKGGAVRWPIAAVSAVFIVLIGLNLIAQSKFSSDELTLDDLKQCASIDLFETNDYKLSYLISGGNEEGVADRYAADLSRVDSNAIAIPLAQYYAGVGDYTKALDALDRGAKYTRANAEVWQKMFSLYEQMIDPVGGSIGAAQWLQDDTYLNRMVKGYETLCQVNADQLDDVLLTAENNAFLNKLLAADALDPYDFVDALTIFSSLGLDTAYLPDADGNGVPDCAEVQEGSVTWNGGAFTVDSDSTVVFSTVLKNEGSYELAVESSDLGGVAEADVDGAAVTLDASGKAVIEADRLGDSDEPVTIALHVRAGTTVSHVTWNKQ